MFVNHVSLFVTLWATAHQAPMSSTISLSLLKFTSIESVILPNHLILYSTLTKGKWKNITP